MQLEILGRVRLSTDDGPVRLTELEHGLLASAALHDHVGVDTLAEWLWDGDPPSSVRNRVQSLVSGIRRAVEYCQAAGIDIVKLAIQFATAHPGIATTLVSSANPENIRRNIAYASEPLDRELLARVLELLRPIHNHNFTRGRPENRDPILA